MSATERLAKIAAIIEAAQDRNPAYLDSAEMLGIYLLCTKVEPEPDPFAPPRKFKKYR